MTVSGSLKPREGKIIPQGCRALTDDCFFFFFFTDIFQNPELDVESVWSEINYRIRYALETMDLDMLADYLSKRGIE